MTLRDYFTYYKSKNTSKRTKSQIFITFYQTTNNINWVANSVSLSTLNNLIMFWQILNNITLHILLYIINGTSYISMVQVSFFQRYKLSINGTSYVTARCNGHRSTVERSMLQWSARGLSCWPI